MGISSTRAHRSLKSTMHSAASKHASLHCPRTRCPLLWPPVSCLSISTTSSLQALSKPSIVELAVRDPDQMIQSLNLGMRGLRRKACSIAEPSAVAGVERPSASVSTGGADRSITSRGSSSMQAEIAPFGCTGMQRTDDTVPRHPRGGRGILETSGKRFKSNSNTTQHGAAQRVEATIRAARSLGLFERKADIAS